MKKLLSCLALTTTLTLGASPLLEPASPSEPSEDATSTRTPSRGGVLVDSITGGFPPGTFATNSQELTDAAPPVVADYYNVAADDVFVDACDTWSVTSLEVHGNYFASFPGPSEGPAESMNVYVFADAGGFPDTELLGSAVYAAEDLDYDDIGLADFEITLPSPLILDGGAGGTGYWIAFQARQAIFTNAQWGWTQSDIDNGVHDAVWEQHSAGILSTSSCVVGSGGWGTLADCGVDGGGPMPKTQLAFAMFGEVLAKEIAVAPGDLSLVEGGATGQISVVLGAPPCSDVTLTLSDDDAGDTEVSLSPSVLDFTAANWNVAQVVTVTPLHDLVVDGDSTTTVTLTPSGADVEYSALMPSTVLVDVANIDGTGAIDVSPNAGLEVSEDGTVPVTISAAGASDPTMPVSLDVASVTGDVEIVGTPATVTLTGPTYSTVVTVAGLADDFVDGDSPFEIVFAASVSGDPAYGGIVASSIAGTVLDADVPSVGVVPAADPIVVDEADAGTRGGNTITYSLSHDPQTAVVEIDLATDSTEATLDPSTVVLDTGNWTGVDVTVSPVDEDVDDGDVDYEIVANATQSSTAAWDGLPVANSSARTLDDDTAGVSASAPGESVLDEGATTTFEVRLTSAPLFDASLTVASADASEILLRSGLEAPAATTVLVFSPADWDVPREVEVIAQIDGSVDGDVPVDLRVEAWGGSDGTYENLPTGEVLATVTVRNVDAVVEVPVLGPAGLGLLATVLLLLGAGRIRRSRPGT